MILPSDFGVYIQRKLKHDLKEISALSCSLLYYSQCHCCSVAQSCLTVCDPMDCSTPGFPVHHQLPEFTQTHVHRVGDAIQPPHHLSCLLLSPSIFPSIRVFSNESVFHIRWPKYWSSITE